MKTKLTIELTTEDGDALMFLIEDDAAGRTAGLCQGHLDTGGVWPIEDLQLPEEQAIEQDRVVADLAELLAESLPSGHALRRPLWKLSQAGDKEQLVEVTWHGTTDVPRVTTEVGGIYVHLEPGSTTTLPRKDAEALQKRYPGQIKFVLDDIDAAADGDRIVTEEQSGKIEGQCEFQKEGGERCRMRIRRGEQFCKFHVKTE